MSNASGRYAPETDGEIAHTAAAVVTRRRIRWGRIITHDVPTFTYVFVVYVVAKIVAQHFGSSLNGPIFVLGSYAPTWVHVLMFMAFMLGILEMLRVSHPGADNSSEVMRIAAIGIIFLVCFVLGASGIAWFKDVFSSADFVLFTCMVWAQAAVANQINTRTAQRGIGAITSH